MCTAGKTVLIVDDDLHIRETLASVFDDEGYTVKVAKHGEDAINQLRSDPERTPCVILLDLMMPVMDGFQFRRELLRDATYSNIPVVILSAGADLQRRTQTLHVSSTLRKPVRLADVLKVVEQHCN